MIGVKQTVGLLKWSKDYDMQMSTLCDQVMPLVVLYFSDELVPKPWK